MARYDGTEGDDIYTGTDEDDDIRGGWGSDTLYGGQGDDWIQGDGLPHYHEDPDFSPDELHGGDGQDGLDGALGDDILYGDAGVDLISGGPGSDTLHGGDDNDTLHPGFEGGTKDDPRYRNYAVFDYAYGDAGDDAIYVNTRCHVEGGDGDDTIEIASVMGSCTGDDGVDRIAFNFTSETENLGSLGYVSVDLSQMWSGGTGSVNGTMTLSRFEVINQGVLSIGNDGFIVGSDYLLATYIEGWFGNDMITGGSGEDRLYGNDGADILNGGDGDDALFGDYFFHDPGATGTDTIHGGDGDDTLSGDNGDDVLWGDIGNDSISGGTGTDQIDGGDGNDILNGDDADDIISGGAGADIISGGTGDDRMRGGADDDTYSVDSARDKVIELAGGGTDRVFATVDYRLSNNVEWLTLIGGDATPIDGTGNASDNRIDGNEQANVLAGLAGADTLYGDKGNDQLDGGEGADTLYGNSGDDTFFVDDAGDAVVEFDSQGYDTVIATVNSVLTADVEALMLGRGGLSGTGNALANAITGGTGDDTIGGADGDDVLDGGRGRDVLTGGLNADTFVFAAAADTAAKRAKADLVTDFRHDEHDLFDVSRIDADRTQDGVQHFAFVGTAAFSHTAGELRFDAGKGGTLVSGDTDGDGKADVSVALTGRLALVVEDFVLLPPAAVAPVNEVRVHAGWRSAGHDWPAPLEQFA